MGNEANSNSVKEEEQKVKRKEYDKRQKSICDWCGFEMFESNCKIICPNYGNRFDCSDLNIYFD